MVPVRLVLLIAAFVKEVQCRSECVVPRARRPVCVGTNTPRNSFRVCGVCVPVTVPSESTLSPCVCRVSGCGAGRLRAAAPATRVICALVVCVRRGGLGPGRPRPARGALRAAGDAASRRRVAGRGARRADKARRCAGDARGRDAARRVPRTVRKYRPRVCVRWDFSCLGAQNKRRTLTGFRRRRGRRSGGGARRLPRSPCRPRAGIRSTWCGS